MEDRQLQDGRKTLLPSIDLKMKKGKIRGAATATQRSTGQVNAFEGRLTGRGEPGNGLLNLGFGERTRPETFSDVPVSDVAARFTSTRGADPTGEVRRGETACRTV